ncbi:MAG: hypothetical protein HF978_19920 [Desulfobacteraceae bacterium]|nr:hypothetical protein [Desulfobacteraceae bacterium]MBC2757817.1 hypothetical protein [Desulfobacteraceae bacterium]
MEDKTKTLPTDKKKYEKPILRVIELAAEEVLAIGCKMFDSGINVAQSTNCGIVNNCVTYGS